MTKTLVMFSGGVDSSYLLYRLVHETQDNLITLRIRRSSRRMSWQVAEDICANKVIQHLLKVRPFEVSNVNIDHVGFEDIKSGSINRAYAAARACVSNPDINRVVLGTVVTDLARESLVRMNCLSRDVFRAILAVYNKPLIPYDYPINDKGKEWAFRDLPAEFLNLASICEKPTIDGDNVIQCNNCRRCNRVAFIKDGLSKGKTPEQLVASRPADPLYTASHGNEVAWKDRVFRATRFDDIPPIRTM